MNATLSAGPIPSRVLTPPARRGWLLLLLLAALAGYRVLLAGSGQLYWPDEWRYGQAYHLLGRIAEGDGAGAVQTLFQAQSRPGFVVFAAVPTALQVLLVKAGVLSYDSQGYWMVPALLNVAVTLVIAALLYGLLMGLLGHSAQALLWTAVYSLLCNTNLYVRHLLPYDAALLSFMLALWLVMRAHARARCQLRIAVITGLLSAGGYLIYPGYYAFVPILAVAVGAARGSSWRGCCVHLAVAGAVLLGTAGLARAAGCSYLQGLASTSAAVGHMAQGSFEEGYVFLGRYLLAVEGPVGVALAALAACGVVLSARRDPGPWRAVLLAAVAMLLLHATMTTVFQRMLFYGRIVHMYLPLMILAAARAVGGITLPAARRWSLGAAAGLSACCFLSFCARYAALSYPRDVQRRISSVVPQGRVGHFSDIGPAPAPAGCNLLGANLEHLYPIDVTPTPRPTPRGFRLVYAARHPLSFEPYHFEGFSIAERRRLRTTPPDMRLYVRHEPESSEAQP